MAVIRVSVRLPHATGRTVAGSEPVADGVQADEAVCSPESARPDARRHHHQGQTGEVQDQHAPHQCPLQSGHQGQTLADDERQGTARPVADVMFTTVVGKL